MRCVQIALALIVVILGVNTLAPTGALGMPTTITEFPVDVGHPVDLGGLLVDPDGNVWFQEHWWPGGSFHALIGRMDEAGKVEEFEKGLGESSLPEDFVSGPDGNVWFADWGGAVGKVAPDGTITRFDAGLSDSQPQTITLGPDGNLWFTALGDSPAVGFATPDGVISTFALPGQPWGAVGGPDGNVWFTYGGAGVAPAIGRVEMQEAGGAVITLFYSGLAADSRPHKIIAAQNGYLWFTDRGKTTAIGRVSMSGDIDEFSSGLDSQSSIGHIAAGPGGDIWFTDHGANSVGRVTPHGQIAEFGSSRLDEPRQIVSGPDGNMWFTHQGGIGKVSPSGEVTHLTNGISPYASPREIVSGPGGRLWFITNNRSDPAIGRIIPGDDRPPQKAGDSREPMNPSIPPGRLAIKRTSLLVSRSGKTNIGLACRSSTPCSGSLRLRVFRRGWAAARVTWASSFSIGAWGSVGVRVQLDRVGRRLLAGGGAFSAWLRFSPVSGSWPINVMPMNQALSLRLAARRQR